MDPVGLSPLSWTVPDLLVGLVVLLGVLCLVGAWRGWFDDYDDMGGDE